MHTSPIEIDPNFSLSRADSISLNPITQIGSRWIAEIPYSFVKAPINPTSTKATTKPPPCQQWQSASFSGSYNSKHIAHITQHPPSVAVQSVGRIHHKSTERAFPNSQSWCVSGLWEIHRFTIPKKTIHTYNHVHTYSRVVWRRSRSLADKRLNQEAFGGGRRQYRSKQADSHAGGGCPIEEKSFTIIFGNWTTTDRQHSEATFWLFRWRWRRRGMVIVRKPLTRITRCKPFPQYRSFEGTSTNQYCHFFY